MYFHNGRWLIREGYGWFSPQQVYETRKEKEEVVLYAPVERIRDKGDTIGGIGLTIRLSAPAPEMIRVQVCHHRGTGRKGPQFELNLPENGALEAEENEQEITVKSGRLSLTVYKENFSMEFRRDGRLLTKSGPRDLAYIKENWTGMAYDSSEKTSYLCEQLGLSAGELIYGLGERFTPFVKNGQSVAIWNEDGGTSTYQSYKNIPFYLSSRNYGVFVNHTEKVEFEVGSELVDRVCFSVKGENLDYFFIGGDSMKEVISRYTDLTGKPPLPPQWSFGVWLSTSFTTNYDEKTVMSFIDGMEERGIPISVFHFDCCWMKEFHWTDFLWDERVFPDPEGLLFRIHEKGIRVCVWINPYIAQQAAIFDEGMEKGYFLKRRDGSVWQWDMWQPAMTLVDFTNPEAKAWYQKKLEGLMDMGVDCFKTDFGERIPLDAVYFDGSDPEKMHNYYTYLYNQAVYEAVEKKRGKAEAVLFARSATAGGQKFPVHWGGDCCSDYESMEQSLRGGLSLACCGFGYWSHDIGGFENTAEPDVYNRWAAFGLLSSHSRFHGSRSYRVPWVYGEESVETVRFFTKLKLELMPYLYSSAAQTSSTGVPMMRPMVLEFGDDPNCLYLDKQYMMGDDLLTAPIFNQEGLASYYLPEGRWTHYLTGEVREGGKFYKEPYGFCSLPLWVRENSIIAIQKGAEDADRDFLDGMEFAVYELSKKAKTTVFQKGKNLWELKLEKEGNTVRGSLKGPEGKEVKICFHGCSLKSAEGGRLDEDGMSMWVETGEFVCEM